MTRVERRSAARLPARLAMEITLGADRARAESLNVSANGVYFSSKAYIPLLTRLRITLELPDEPGSTARVACDGVVVRTEPEVNMAYRTPSAALLSDFLNSSGNISPL